MNEQSLTARLGLAADASPEEIETAYRQRLSQVETELARAEDEVARTRIMTEMQQLTEAYEHMPPTVPLGADASGSPGDIAPTRTLDPGHSREPKPLGFEVGAVVDRGRYEILSVLGKGGMGVVYKARDTVQNEVVALKVTHAHLMENEEIRRRFLDEGKATKRLTHDNIINVYNVERDGDHFFITMEFLAGQSLGERMKKLAQRGQRFPLRDVPSIAEDLCEALYYAHSHGLVHRDVKPANVFITSEGHLKLMDFGIASMDGDGPPTDPGQVMGTPPYMAPEQWEGAHRANHLSDQFAVGLLLYELYTGINPKGSNTVVKDDTKSVNELRPNVPSGVSDAIMRALRTIPEERHQNMRLFWNALRRGWAIHGLDPDEIPTKRRIEEDPAPPARKSRVASVVGLGVVAVAAILFIGPFGKLFAGEDPESARSNGGGIDRASAPIQAEDSETPVKLSAVGDDPRREDPQDEPGALDSTRGGDAERTPAPPVANLDEIGSGGETLLIRAVRQGDAAEVGSLLAAGALTEVEGVQGGVQALHWAAKEGRDEIAGLLIDAGADVLERTDDELTALLYCAENGRTGVMKLLLEHPQRTQLLEQKDRAFERTALHLAAKAGKPESWAMLLEAGASPAVEDRNKQTPLHALAASQSGTEENRLSMARQILERMTLDKVQQRDDENKRALDLARARDSGGELTRLLETWKPTD